METALKVAESSRPCLPGFLFWGKQSFSGNHHTMLLIILTHFSKPTPAMKPAQGWTTSCGKGGKQIPRQQEFAVLPFFVCLQPKMLPSPVIPSTVLDTQRNHVRQRWRAEAFRTAEVRVSSRMHAGTDVGLLFSSPVVFRDRFLFTSLEF